MQTRQPRERSSGDREAAGGNWGASGVGSEATGGKRRPAGRKSRDEVRQQKKDEGVRLSFFLGGGKRGPAREWLKALARLSVFASVLRSMKSVGRGFGRWGWGRSREGPRRYILVGGPPGCAGPEQRRPLAGSRGVFNGDSASQPG